MNNINVTVELCAEDRKRLDKIIDLLEIRADQTQLDLEKKYDKPKDELQKMLEEVVENVKKTDVTEAPKNAQDAPTASDHPTLDPFPETPTAETQASEAQAEAPTVTTSEIQQLVLALCRAGKKDKVREVVSSYGVQTVAAIPEDKLAEAYAKLKKIEG